MSASRSMTDSTYAAPGVYPAHPAYPPPLQYAYPYAPGYYYPGYPPSYVQPAAVGGIPTQSPTGLQAGVDPTQMASGGSLRGKPPQTDSKADEVSNPEYNLMSGGDKMQGHGTYLPGHSTPLVSFDTDEDVMNNASGGYPRSSRSLHEKPLSLMGRELSSGENSQELELRERRKRSNRESARRSRLRKQVEFEELVAKMEHLSKENMHLKQELLMLQERLKTLQNDNEKLVSQANMENGG